MFNLPYFDPARPPPVAPPNLWTNQSSLDQSFVQHFINTRPERKAASKASPASISKFRQNMTDLVGELDLLKTKKATLEKEMQLQPDSNWRAGIQQLEHLQHNISEKFQQLSDPTLNEQLQRKLKARQKKRIWQKRRNARLKQQKHTQINNRETLHEKINTWQAEQRKLLEEDKQAQQQLEYAHNFLADVHRRKAACKRYLAKFQQVHETRRRHRLVNTVDDIAELTKKWTTKLAECVREEKRLKDVLARRSAANFQRRVENEWNRALFGDVIPKRFEHPLLLAERDRSVLVQTRKDWDACLVYGQDGDALAIPLGWVLPPKEAAPEWAEYLVKETS